MLIKDMSAQIKTFDDLNPGDAFMLGSYVFIKVKDFTMIDKDNMKALYNAICLSEGDLHYFAPFAKITAPKIEVTIER